jgi:hypothetical protein
MLSGMLALAKPARCTWAEDRREIQRLVCSGPGEEPRDRVMGRRCVATVGHDLVRETVCERMPGHIDRIGPIRRGDRIGAASGGDGVARRS